LLRSIGVGEALPQLALARLEVLLALGDLVFEERKREVELPQLRRELIVMRLHRVDRLRRGRDLGLDRRLVRVDLVELGRRIVDGALRGFLVGLEAREQRALAVDRTLEVLLLLLGPVDLVGERIGQGRRGTEDAGLGRERGDDQHEGDEAREQAARATGDHVAQRIRRGRRVLRACSRARVSGAIPQLAGPLWFAASSGM